MCKNEEQDILLTTYICIINPPTTPHPFTQLPPPAPLPSSSCRTSLSPHPHACVTKRARAGLHSASCPFTCACPLALDLLTCFISLYPPIPAPSPFGLLGLPLRITTILPKQKKKKPEAPRPPALVWCRIQPLTFTATMAAATTTTKAQNSAQPHLPSIGIAPPPMEPPLPPLNSQDPEKYLKRCSGYCKKTNLRCSASIGKKAQKDTRPTYLPTCALHRDQQSLAGWCQFTSSDGRRCARLFRWNPPHFELCNDHQGHPSTPCYFLKQLPLELRHEVYRYLIPTEPIDSSTAAVHDRSSQEPDQRASRLPVLSYPSPMRATRVLRSKFPMRLLDLLSVSRQVHDEVKDRLFSTVTFKIDIRKDGTFMCGRRLLEPKRADGSSHFLFDEADHAKRKFLKCFDWASAKNYAVDILLENCPIANPQHVPSTANMTMRSRWDEEVEIYDIRGQSIVPCCSAASYISRLHLCSCLWYPGKGKESLQAPGPTLPSRLWLA